ncbi:MAG: hypothetical protein Q9191_006886, partial [Dirinaria sp. TL-2023a]
MRYIDNVDYDDLKQAIRNHTTPSDNQPRLIPGVASKADTLGGFEDRLYTKLSNEHERVDLFVRSKTGELTRRLEQLDRFVRVNRQAFRKILKKYMKWTDSPDLEQRFKDNVLSRPSSLANRSFIPALAHYKEILAGITASSSPTTPIKPSKLPSSGKYSERENIKKSFSSIASNIQYVYEHGTEIEFDTILAVLDLGHNAGRACYWVHVDNLLQIQVVLLRYMRSRANQICTSVPASSNVQDSGRILPNRSPLTTGSPSENEVCVVICDDIEDFTNQKSRLTISDSEISSGPPAERSAASIRLSADGKAVAAISSSPRDAYPLTDLKAAPLWRTAKFKGKSLGTLLSYNTQLNNCSAPAETPESQQVNGLEVIQDFDAWSAAGLPSISPTDAQRWFQNREKVRPLVEIHSKRTRFAGIRNTKSSGVWATIDTDIMMVKCSASSLASRYNRPYPTEDASIPRVPFPHAILNIRFEGDADMVLIEKLNSSHLVQRIRGFSLDTHAVATLYEPPGMSPPYWLPLLKQDIRKYQREGDASSQLALSAQLTPRSGSTRANSETTISVGDGLTDSGLSSRLRSSDTSVPDLSEPSQISALKARKLRSQSRNTRVHDHLQRQNARYWNEFDDGYKGTDENTYTILIDPIQPSTFPVANALARIARVSVQKVTSFLYHHQPIDLERRPLLEDQHAGTRSSSDESGLEEGNATPATRTRSRQALRSYKSPLVRVCTTRDTYLTSLCIACFVLSFVLLFMEVILVNTSRRKAIPESDIGVLVGVIFSLVLGVGGLGAPAAREE